MPIASTEDNHEVPRVESTRISVIDIYTSYARRGQEPAEVTARSEEHTSELQSQ